MSEYQITSWRDLPSMVVARDGDEVAKIQLAARFQIAIDEAAMRLGETSSDDYLSGWVRAPWTTGEGEPAALAGEVAKALEEQWTDEAIAQFLDGLGSADTTG